MKVAMIIQAYLPRFGGAEKLLAASLPYLRARGVEPLVLTRRYPGMAPFEMIDGTLVYRLPAPGPKVTASLCFTLSGVLRLRQICPDLIHAHELLSPSTTAVLAKRLIQKPVVVTLHRGGLLGDIYKLNHRIGGRTRIKMFQRQVDGLISISREIDQELADSGFLPQKRHFIPNGVDIQRFSIPSQMEKQALREKFSMSAVAPVFLYTGRLVPEKRVDLLLRIWQEIRPQTGGAQLWILGSGPEEESLRQMQAEGVHFTGYVEDPSPYLRAADVFVLPSATEGLSVAMLEALASGLVCILTRVGGAADVVQHNQNGLLVDPDSPAEMREALLSVLQNTKLRVELGQAARQTIVEGYSLAGMADHWVDLYRKVSKA